MPLARVFQLAAKVESSEGQEETLTADDVVVVTEVSVDDSTDFEENNTSGQSLSGDFQTAGRTTRTMTFQQELRGNTTGATDQDKSSAAPPWDRFLRPSGFEKVGLQRVTGSITSGPFMIGEILDGGSGGSAVVVTPSKGSEELFVIPLEGALSGTLTGRDSGASISTPTITDDYGTGYRFVSQKTARVEVDTWTSTPSIGDVFTVFASATSKEQVATGQILADRSVSDTFVDLEVLITSGGLAAGNVMRVGSRSAAVETVEALAGPSLTLLSNQDGKRRVNTGARGDFTLDVPPGDKGTFSFTFEGSGPPATDEAPIPGASADPLAAPRFQEAMLHMGYNRGDAGSPDHFFACLPLKSFQLAISATVELHTNPCAPEGIDGSNITDRDPTVTIEVDHVGVTGFDWGGALRNSTPIRFGFVFGTEVGNRVGIICPRCQVTSLSDGEAEGLLTDSVELKLRRILEAGDDELFIVKF